MPPIATLCAYFRRDPRIALKTVDCMTRHLAFS
jgi:hypothetical protein